MGEAWEENRACRCVPGPGGGQCPCPCHTPGGIPFPSGYSVPVIGPAGVESAGASDGPCPNPEPCPLHPRRTGVVQGSSIVIKQDFRNADPDRIAMDITRSIEAMQGQEFGRLGTGQLRRSFAPRGTAQDILDAVEEVKPCGVRLVGVVLQGPAPTRWWRWVEPVALWLLRRAGFEVCQ